VALALIDFSPMLTCHNSGSEKSPAEARLSNAGLALARLVAPKNVFLKIAAIG
jgi:hypothetical protein